MFGKAASVARVVMEASKAMSDSLSRLVKVDRPLPPTDGDMVVVVVVEVEG